MSSGVDALYPVGRTITQTSKAADANKHPGKSQIADCVGCSQH